MSEDALYYPYIHVRPRDLGWLKATLLCFPHVYRMVPSGFEVNDHPSIGAFTRLPTSEQPLLRSFGLDHASVAAVQASFHQRLLEDERERGTAFFETFRRGPTQAQFDGNDSAFQIHRAKFAEPLFQDLERLGLAWSPSQPYRGDWWVAVHPRLGEALMSTIAAAIAHDRDFRVVTSRGRVHRALLTRDPISAYDTLVRGQWAAGQPDVDAVVDEMAQVVVMSNFRVDQLTPEEIGAIVADGGGLARFKDALEEFAGEVGKVVDQEHREQKIRVAAQKVIDRWQAEQKGGPGALLKRLASGEGLADQGEDFVKTVAQDLVQGAALTLGSATLAGAGIGLAIGVVFYAGKTLVRQQLNRAHSPFRYLTRIEQKGAAFVMKAPR